MPSRRTRTLRAARLIAAGWDYHRDCTDRHWPEGKPCLGL